MNLKDAQHNDILLPVSCVDLDSIYPIGAIYMTVLNANPADMFGGSWSKLEDTFLLACGTEYIAGETGGASEITLTEANIPEHAHTLGESGTLTSGTYANHSHVFYFHNNVDGYKGGSDRHGYHNSAGTGYTLTSNSTGGHPHTVLGHGHDLGVTGEGEAHNNMPPYYTVYMWVRIE